MAVNRHLTPARGAWLAAVLVALAAGSVHGTALADRGSDRGWRGGDDDDDDHRGRGRGRDDDRDGGRRESRGMSIDAAIDLVLGRYGGRVVKAEVLSSDGRTFYLIRVLTDDGVLRRVRVDASSGRMD